MAAPAFPAQVEALRAYLQRELSSRFCELFRPGSATAYCLLPLATGHEHDPPSSRASPSELFAASQAKLASVLGHAIGNVDGARFDPDSVWPPGLVVVEDCGCAIYRAVDLDHPRLRVIQYEHFEPVADRRAAAGSNARLAFSEPVVPRALQHRFVIVADTLDEWLRELVR